MQSQEGKKREKKEREHVFHIQHCERRRFTPSTCSAALQSDWCGSTRVWVGVWCTCSAALTRKERLPFPQEQTSQYIRRSLFNLIESSIDAKVYCSFHWLLLKSYDVLPQGWVPSCSSCTQTRRLWMLFRVPTSRDTRPTPTPYMHSGRVQCIHKDFIVLSYCTVQLRTKP